MLQSKGGRWDKGLICHVLAHSVNDDGDSSNGESGNNDSNSDSGDGNSDSGRKNNNQLQAAAGKAVTVVSPQYF